MHSELVIPGGSDEGESMGLIQPWVQLGFRMPKKGTEFGKDSGPCSGEPTMSQRAGHFPFAFSYVEGKMHRCFVTVLAFCVPALSTGTPGLKLIVRV